jgi:alkylhydroperoxidase family enzyme
MAHLLDDPLPADVYSPAEAAIVRYAVKSTRMEPIDDVLYGELATHFGKEQIIDLCLTVGLSNMINRFHATFLTDVDDRTLAEVEAGNAEPGSCPIPLPDMPA